MIIWKMVRELRKVFLYFVIILILFSSYIVFYFITRTDYVYKDNVQRSNDEIKVAVIDSGINPNMKLKESIVETKSYLNSNNDELDHGTPISEIILANNDSLDKTVSLYSYKVINKEGIVNKADFLIALQDIKDRKEIDIVNISFGFRNNFPEIEKIINDLVDQGVVIIASSGNNHGLDADYPARYSNVISVSSIDKNNKPLKFNSKGKIDFVAMGSNVQSISSDGLPSQYSGSSFATAFITNKVIKVLDKKDIPKNKERYQTVYQELKNISVRLGDREIYGEGAPVLE